MTTGLKVGVWFIFVLSILFVIAEIFLYVLVFIESYKYGVITSLAYILVSILTIPMHLMAVAFSLSMYFAIESNKKECKFRKMSYHALIISLVGLAMNVIMFLLILGSG